MSVIWYVRHSTVMEMRRTDEQFNIRMPDGMRKQIADRARSNLRSMNSEIVIILAHALGNQVLSTTGKEFGDTIPAAGSNDTALQGGPEIHG